MRGPFHPGLASVLMATGLAVAAARAETNAPPSPAETLASAMRALNPVFSADGRFAAVGPGTAANRDLLRWAEELTARVERLVGTRVPFEGRTIRVVVRPPPPAAEAETNALPATCVAERRREGDRRVDRLELSAASAASAPEAEEAFCTLLLDGNWAGTNAVPAWLIVAVTRNLRAEQRDANARHVLDAWQRGALPPLADWFGAPADRPPSESYRACHGALLAWLMEARPDTERGLGALRARLAAGARIDLAWLSGQVPGCHSAPDLEERWENWIIGQRRVRRGPAAVDADAVARLGAALLLYPGSSGIPLSDDPYRGLPWSDLVTRRKEAWVPAFVQAKLTTLRMLEPGRDEEYVAAVETYARFLEALAGRTRPGRLEALLREAEQALAGLQARYRPADAAAASTETRTP